MHNARPINQLVTDFSLWPNSLISDSSKLNKTHLHQLLQTFQVYQYKAIFVEPADRNTITKSFTNCYDYDADLHGIGNCSLL